jgi:hypothetical protein
MPSPSYELPAEPLVVLAACGTGNVASPTTLRGPPRLAYQYIAQASIMSNIIY